MARENVISYRVTDQIITWPMGVNVKSYNLTDYVEHEAMVL